MFSLVILTLVVAGLCLVLNKISQGKWKNAPPGPVGLPIVGSLLQLAEGGQPLEIIQKWKEMYGDVVGIRLGQYRVVFLNSYDTIKEAYTTSEFSGRQLLKPFEAITGGVKCGLAFSDGHVWAEQRRFALRNLRDFGFGKKSMESMIQEDIADLIDTFKGFEGKPFVPHRTYSTAVVRSLWNMIAGERFPYGDPRFQAVLDSFHIVLSSTSITGPAFFMPWLVKLFPDWTCFTAFYAAVTKAKELIGKYIAEHKKTYQPDTARDYIDVYLREIEATTDPSSSFHEASGADSNLLVGTLNLFAAGAETTSNTIVWTLLYLIQYPDVQEELFQEIKSVIGMSRLPSLEDRDSCPYTLAVMEEAFRMSTLVPLAIFHNTMEDVTFRGYNIPKDTLVAPNLFGVHHDKAIWGDPEVFRPERFLSEDKKKLISGPGPVIAFSVGKRVCLGETLARNNFFLYLTSLVQKFEFSPGQEGDLKVDASPGLTRTPQPFKILINERDVE